MQKIIEEVEKKFRLPPIFSIKQSTKQEGEGRRIEVPVFGLPKDKLKKSIKDLKRP